ncbi:hypothetical protein OSTOST_25726 [Ostertagia ostertagi]
MCLFQLLPHFKKEHVSHIIEVRRIFTVHQFFFKPKSLTTPLKTPVQTMMMDDEELADEQGSEGESTNDEDEDMGDGEATGESGVDPEALNRLESALGKAAVKRKGDAIDEEESDASDVDDAEMFALDDRLAAAFKAMAPKKSEK